MMTAMSRISFSKGVRRALMGFLVSHLCIPAMVAQIREPTEFELKAAIIYNFALFTEWPVLPDNHFTFCIYGLDLFGSAIDALTDYTLLNRSIKIQRVHQFENIADCHLLYISSLELEEVESLITITRNYPILTIVDQLETGNYNPVIRLWVEHKKISFDINLSSAKNSGLHISTKLLRLARQVY